MADTETITALRTWRDGLINLTAINRALNFRHTKTGTVPITSPGLQEILAGLRAGRTWRLEGEQEVDPAAGHSVVNPALTGTAVLHCDIPEKDLTAALRNLARRAKQEYLDRGLSVMYVALGMLHWLDDDDTAYTSPLLLVPVDFIAMGQKEKPRLRVGEDDPTVNPALTLRMRDFDVTLPTLDGLDDLADLDLTALLQQMRAATSRKSPWSVTEDAVLSAFSFHKEAMYRDLLANEATIVGHPLVTALAHQDPETQNQSLLFDAIRPEDIDRLAPPETTPLALDADSSQRACVAAAVAGHSFVMDGPPGTGKSQTIASMIGAMLHVGRTVLFVSEKAAALEVVRNRLDHVGLAPYLLELHSHKVSRKQVATTLLEALDTLPVPASGDEQPGPPARS